MNGYVFLCVCVGGWGCLCEGVGACECVGVGMRLDGCSGYMSMCMCVWLGEWLFPSVS